MTEQPTEVTEPGYGHPRLVVVPAGGHASADGPAAQGEEITFALGARTTIGSAEGQDIRIRGLAPEHAVIEWVEEGDEYVFQPLVLDDAATVDGKPITTGLHHGDRLDLGGTVLIYQRDEYASHVRKDERARQGGGYAGGGITSAGGHATEHGHGT